jgi:hypothetical protein
MRERAARREWGNVAKGGNGREGAGGRRKLSGWSRGRQAWTYAMTTEQNWQGFIPYPNDAPHRFRQCGAASHASVHLSLAMSRVSTVTSVRLGARSPPAIAGDTEAWHMVVRSSRRGRPIRGGVERPRRVSWHQIWMAKVGRNASCLAAVPTSTSEAVDLTGCRRRRHPK